MKRNTWPKNRTHFEMIDAIEKTLKKQEKWIWSGKLAELVADELGRDNYSTVKTCLSEHREYLNNNEPFISEEKGDGTPGKTTVYWRHEDNDVSGKVSPHD